MSHLISVGKHVAGRNQSGSINTNQLSVLADLLVCDSQLNYCLDFVLDDATDLRAVQVTMQGDCLLHCVICGDPLTVNNQQ